LSENKSVAATTEEILVAINDLSVVDMCRLKQSAKYRLWALGKKGFGLSPMDLVQGALVKTLKGTRSWKYGEVTFIHHLLGVIWSDTSNWAGKVGRRAPTKTEADLPLAEHSEGNPLQMYADNKPRAERALAAKEQLEAIEDLVKNDKLAYRILQLLRQQMKGPEIQGDLQISKTTFESKMKWIRRAVRRAAKKGEV